MHSLIYPHERLDDLQLGGLSVIQDPLGFGFGVDAVLLANFARAQIGERTLDLGTGSGVIPILMSAKGSGSEYVGIEIQPEVAERAQRSVKYNVSQGRLREDLVRIKQGDLRSLPKNTYDLVTSNPPYTPIGAGIINTKETIKISRHECCATLADVVEAAERSLRPKGRFAMVHRPHRLSDIITLMRTYGLEPKRLQMVYPHHQKQATHILIEGHKGAKPFLEVLPPLVQSLTESQ